MSQNDMSIANQGFAVFRSDLNSALQALASTSKGSSRPATPYAGQIWLDDNTPSATVWTVFLYDGAQDIAIGLFDTTNDRFQPWGGLGARVVAKVGAYTVGVEERGQLHDVSHATGFTVTLPAAAIATNGFGLSFRNTGAANIILDGNAAETIDGSTTYVIPPGQSVAIACDGSNWHTVASGFRPSGFAAHRNGVDQVGIVTGTDTKIKFTTELWDLQGEFVADADDSGGATESRFTPTEPGIYLAIVKASVISLTDGKTVRPKIFRNGGATAADRWTSIDAVSATLTGHASAIAFVQVNGTTDYLEAYVQHDHGSNRDVLGTADATWFQVMRVA